MHKSLQVAFYWLPLLPVVPDVFEQGTCSTCAAESQHTRLLEGLSTGNMQVMLCIAPKNLLSLKVAPIQLAFSRREDSAIAFGHHVSPSAEELPDEAPNEPYRAHFLNKIERGCRDHT